MKQKRLLNILLSITFLFFFCPGNALEPDCNPKMDGYNLPTPTSKFLCLDKYTVLDDDKTIPNDFNVVYVENATDIALTSKQIKRVFAGKKFTLVIHGICAGKCSRLLLPLAQKTHFSKGSFAALTDSSIDSWQAALGKVLNEYSQNGDNFRINQSTLNDFEKTQIQKIASQYLTDIEIIATTKTNITHLTWHSNLYQSLVNGKGRYCVPIKSMAIVLTPAYLRYNDIRTTSASHLPLKQVLVTNLKKEFGENTMVFYSYDENWISDCKP